MKKEIKDLINEHIKILNSKQVETYKKEQAIRLDKNELPYSPSSNVIKAIIDAATTINRYPEVLDRSLREKLAKYTGTKTEQIIIGNGSDDLIELIIKVFVQPGDEVLLPIPTFFVYEFATRCFGGVPIYVKRTKDFDIDVETILEKITPRTKVLFIANPNNPTANLISRNVILEILNKVDCIVIIDECYYEFCKETIVDLVDQYPNLIVLRSLSKSFGLAGVRLGYGITNEIIIDYLYRITQIFPINKLALVAANIALEDKAYIISNIHNIVQERCRLIQEIQQLGFVVYPSATNFLFVNTKPLEITSQDLVQSLQERNIYVLDFGLKQGLDAYYFRTSVGTVMENRLLVEALKNAIS